MRFIDGGPNIPDELLWARAQGKVVFFCGAGVSKAANPEMPDFITLANAVADELALEDESAVRIALRETIRLANDPETNLGLISADKIFGLMEREVRKEILDQATANVLAKAKTDNTAIHQALLDLATTPIGKHQIVTTNFDRMFEIADSNLRCFTRGNLPSLNLSEGFDGLVYLHGRLDQAWHNAESGGLVLTPADFGDAYLGEGWATKFLKALMEKYVLVFIGYSADDPPINYLLEGLERNSQRKNAMYAFQDGSDETAAAKWAHKGVKAISYQSGLDHHRLWQSIYAWADRAKNEHGWREQTVKLALNEPDNLSAVERGQVAHLVSSTLGAKMFAELQDEGTRPPATWLGVFDPAIRYAPPRNWSVDFLNLEWVDPFVKYCLDCDCVPEPEIGEEFPKRAVPGKAWDAFAISDQDRQEVQDYQIGRLRETNAYGNAALLDRHWYLMCWIAHVAGQAAALRWAVQQTEFHPQFHQMLNIEIGRKTANVSDAIRRAWYCLMDGQQRRRFLAQQDMREVSSKADDAAWHGGLVASIAEREKPYLVLTDQSLPSPALPTEAEFEDFHHHFQYELEVPSQELELEVSQDWLLQMVQARRSNLEHAVRIGKEVAAYRLGSLPPIFRSKKDEFGHNRVNGLGSQFLIYVRDFKRLAELAPDLAKGEVNAWPVDDNTIFGRLRLWIVGFEALVPNDQIGQYLSSLDSEMFWGLQHQRDLLLSLKDRWPKLAAPQRREIELIILRGRNRFEDENEAKYEKRRASLTLERLVWLSENDCHLTDDTSADLKIIQSQHASWESRFAEGAVEPMESGGGWVGTDENYSHLLATSEDNILDLARETTGWSESYENKSDPFSGLAKEEPAIALRVLLIASKQGDWPEWAWQKFLGADNESKDAGQINWKIRAVVLLLQMPPNSLEALAHDVASWIRKHSMDLASECGAHFVKLTDKLIDVLGEEPLAGGSNIGGGNHGWAMEGLNAPAGKIAEAIFRLPAVSDEKGLPVEWQRLAERLLALPGEMRCHAVVMLSYHLNWIFERDPMWARQHLLSVLSDDELAAGGAFWDGVAWGTKHQFSPELFQILKPHFIQEIVAAGTNDYRHIQKLAALALLHWAFNREIEVEKRLGDDDFRYIILHGGDELRINLLWILERWSDPEDERGAGGGDWPALTVELFQKVWPRHRLAQSAQTSRRLAEFLFRMDSEFDELSDLIVPLLTKSEEKRLDLYKLTRKGGAKSKDPKRILAVIDAILTDDVAIWPMELSRLLAILEECCPDIVQDARFIRFRDGLNNS